MLIKSTILKEHLDYDIIEIFLYIKSLICKICVIMGIKIWLLIPLGGSKSLHLNLDEAQM